jgi:riboflavin synthase
MFTGIIEALGIVGDLQLRSSEWRMRIDSDALDFADVKDGDSIAVNGACLTVVQKFSGGFAADVSAETMRLTTLNSLRRGTLVNLEKALAASARLGGHIVSGHVDGVGELLRTQPEGGSIRMDFRAPAELARYIAKKGSICIDGTSLTVNEVDGAVFSINVIPHTQLHTVMHTYRTGQAVNLEVDLISRYLERLLLGERAADSHASDINAGNASGITREFLTQHWFRGTE